jgi:hypothetical protein
MLASTNQSTTRKTGKEYGRILTTKVHITNDETSRCSLAQRYK